MWQIDGAAHKLKPRLFYKSVYLQDHLADFHPWYELCFSKKEECYNIIRNWQMTFQASNLRGKQFLDLLDDNLHSIKLSYKKGGPWIKHLRHSNLLCARAT